MLPSMLMASLAVFALQTGPRVAPATTEAATSIERALIERACGAEYTPWADEAAQQCFSDHLLTLRTDFGRDLSNLSIADRKAIDMACLDLQRPERQDARVDCLSGRLAAIREREHKRLGIAPDPATDATIVPASSVVVDLPAGQMSSWRGVAIGGLIVTLVSATAGFGFLAMRPRRIRRTCRVCGVDSPGADLCAPCRHEAAEAIKRETAERSRNATSLPEQPRQERGAAEHVETSPVADVVLSVAPAVESGVNESMSVRSNPPADHVEERADIRLEETLPEMEATEPVFDPYDVLGVPHDAAQDAISTAYELARKRYDPEQVAFLGYDAQEHFRLKAESVERAYRMLCAT